MILGLPSDLGSVEDTVLGYKWRTLSLALSRCRKRERRRSGRWRQSAAVPGWAVYSAAQTFGYNVTKPTAFTLSSATNLPPALSYR